MPERKILYVATVVKTHIAQFHLPYIAAMHKLGWHTAVAAKNDYINPKDLNIPECDSYFDIPFQRNPLKRENIKAYRLLKEVINKGDYDIIHCHTPVGALLARLAGRQARKKGTKIIYTAHGFHFYKGAPLKNWLVYFPAEWVCAFMTDVLITINHEDYAFAQNYLHAGKVIYLPGVGVDLGKIGISSERRAEIRKNLGVSEADFMLLSVAEVSQRKNQTVVLDALQILKNPYLKFISAGSGDMLGAMIEKTRKLNLENSVSFLGYRSDANELYGAADAFIFPSLQEGLPVALMEAMASGLPSIVGVIRGNVDLITDKVEGLHSELTPKALAENIMELYSNPELRDKLGQAAKKKVSAFGLEPVLQAVKEIYLKEAGNRI